MKADFSMITGRSDCLTLASDSLQKQQPLTQVEGLIHFAKFVALERLLPKNKASTQGLLDEGLNHMQTARKIVDKFPSTRSLSDELEAAESTLRESTFYAIVTSEERQAIYAAMAQDFQGTGHWYYCVNMHPVSTQTTCRSIILTYS